MLLLLAHNAIIFHYILIAQHYLHGKQSVNRWWSLGLPVILELSSLPHRLRSFIVVLHLVHVPGALGAIALRSITVQSSNIDFQYYVEEEDEARVLLGHRNKEIKCNSWCTLILRQSSYNSIRNTDCTTYKLCTQKLGEWVSVEGELKNPFDYEYFKFSACNSFPTVIWSLHFLCAGNG